MPIGYCKPCSAGRCPECVQIFHPLADCWCDCWWVHIPIQKEPAVPKLWCPGAERIPGPHSAGGSMVGGPPRVVWHRTAGGSYESNRAYLVSKGYEPHLLWDPHSGQIGQFIPANRSAYALAHTASPETNRMGRYCIQIEVVDHGQRWDITDTPMKGVETIVGWLRQLGVPDVLPAGPMARLGRSGKRDPHVWVSKAGHYGHCHVPQNDHSDPGRMDFRKIFGHDTDPPRKPRRRPTTRKRYRRWMRWIRFWHHRGDHRK